MTLRFEIWYRCYDEVDNHESYSHSLPFVPRRIALHVARRRVPVQYD
jgi:hypothetical protein